MGPIDKATAWSLGLWLVTVGLIAEQHSPWLCKLGPSEWAAWVQALGSIAAISASLAVGRNQAEAVRWDRERTQASEEYERGAALLAHLTFITGEANAVVETIRRMNSAGLPRSDPGLRTLLRCNQTLVELLTTPLGPVEVIALSKVRFPIAQLIEIAEGLADSARTGTNSTRVTKALDVYQRNAEAAFESLKAHTEKAYQRTLGARAV
ncbi:hypothetical protein [Roseateles flavus]|uniref:Uncharacterized protein n=1 Tax=Roseateles flavus TaxID=3149041 RepID=A0ABV0GAX3_9BURK